MPLVVLAVGLVAAPPQVQIVTQGSATSLVRAGMDVRAALAAGGRLEVRPQVLVSDAPPPSHTELAAAKNLIARARQDYANLDPQAALAKLAEAQEDLRTVIDQETAVQQLAAALRVEGLTQLFVEKTKEAAPQEK